jgi:hypothetical protein
MAKRDKPRAYRPVAGAPLPSADAVLRMGTEHLLCCLDLFAFWKLTTHHDGKRRFYEVEIRHAAEGEKYRTIYRASARLRNDAIRNAIGKAVEKEPTRPKAAGPRLRLVS